MTKQATSPKVLSIIVFLLIATAAYASPVTVTGGFTSFSGVVFGNTLPSFLNGQQICPTVGGCATTEGLGNSTFGTPQQSVTFQGFSPVGPEVANSVQFVPATAQDVSGPGIEFLLGTFTFRMAHGAVALISAFN
jgi:hypothetical protein